MTIHIEELTFECIIGILDFERITVQEVIVNLQIDYTYKNNLFINYVEVIQVIEDDMIKNKYELLETAINELKNILLLTYPQIQNLKLKITKPNIIKNAKVSLSKSFSIK